MNTPINVLLVDDNKRNLTALEAILASPELKLLRAATADEALLWLVHNEFACIVLDVQMPGMNGFELARLIKTRRRSQLIPIIFITAYLLEEKDVLQGYGAGAVDYLTKPINPQILKSKVGVFVDLFRTTRALASVNGALQLEINQRKKAEDALRETSARLELRVQDRVGELQRTHEDVLAASRAKDNFLARLAQELRAPLSSIAQTAGKALKNRKLPPKARTDFETILKNAELETRLANDLVDLTNITRGKISLEKKPVDVHVVLRDALANVREEFEQKQITSTLRAQAAQHMVFADPVRLQQVFWNVLRNAVKFTPATGRITVDTDVAQANRLVVRVTDTGVGMNPAELAQLFNSILPTDDIGSSGRRLGGMGLGLSISQKLVELHSGRIQAFSQGRDKGSTFTVELPLMPAYYADGTRPVGMEPQSIGPNELSK